MPRAPRWVRPRGQGRDPRRPAVTARSQTCAFVTPPSPVSRRVPSGEKATPPTPDRMSCAVSEKAWRSLPSSRYPDVEPSRPRRPWPRTTESGLQSRSANAGRVPVQSDLPEAGGGVPDGRSASPGGGDRRPVRAPGDVADPSAARESKTPPPVATSMTWAGSAGSMGAIRRRSATSSGLRVGRCRLGHCPDLAGTTRPVSNLGEARSTPSSRHRPPTGARRR